MIPAQHAASGGGTWQRSGGGEGGGQDNLVGQASAAWGGEIRGEGQSRFNVVKPAPGKVTSFIVSMVQPGSSPAVAGGPACVCMFAVGTPQAISGVCNPHVSGEIGTKRCGSSLGSLAVRDAAYQLHAAGTMRDTYSGI